MRPSHVAALLLAAAFGSPHPAQSPAAPLAPQSHPTPPIGARSEPELGEYRFNLGPGAFEAWSATNPSHGFRASISAHGLEVVPRTRGSDELEAEWRMQLRTACFGRRGGASELPPASIRENGERVELDHGALVEWFVNEPRGLEQGWTVHQRPVGDGELWIGLALEGDLSLRIEEGARSGTLVDSRGRTALRYRDLIVLDAAGRELPARMLSSELGLGIAVDDAGAQYPLTVDPIISQAAWTVLETQSFAQFGSSVASAGDVNGDGYSDVIVGAPAFDNGQTDEGRARVYLGSATGLSTIPAWTAESNQASANFGCSVACAGDVNGDGFSDVIIGARLLDNGQTDEGRAFVYLGSPAGLAAGPAWTTEGDQASAQFGSSVASAGDVNGDGYGDVIVGAPLFDGGQINNGRAFVYLGSPAGLATSPAWTAESAQQDALFGDSVASAGDVNGDGYGDVIVGAPWINNGQLTEGRAFLYLGSPAGLSVTPTWTQESNQIGANFGNSVASAGDVNGDGFSDVIVGARYFESTPFDVDEGRAFVYLGSSSGLASTPAWTMESNQAGAWFGTSVAGAGDVNGDGYSDVIIGAKDWDNGFSSSGDARVYLGSSAGLGLGSILFADVFDYSDADFGNSTASAGDVNGDGYSDFIVGAPLALSRGAAFAYHGTPWGEVRLLWSTETNQTGAKLGSSVASAGDVNGDGYGDVLVGAPGFDNGQNDEGRAQLHLGSSTGPATSPAWTAEGDQAGAEFGCSVASAGDVNGDGYYDVIVGACKFDNGQTDEGRAYLYLGSPVGLATSPAWTAESNQADAGFGYSVASTGDVNGDGYGDVIIGAHLFDSGQSNEGRAFVYLGSASGLASNPAWTAEGNKDLASFGISVASAGDVNGDGYGDVIVGADRFENGQTDEGRAVLYLGSPTGLATSPAWSAEGNQAFAHFGISLARAGDVNGDGYGDVIIGTHGFDNGQADEGRAFVYLGSPAGLATSPAWSAEGNQADAWFGNSVASAGDLNADGYADVLIGAYLFDVPPYVNTGRAFVFLGSSSGLATQPVNVLDFVQANSNFGHSVASAGDANGDGYSDLIVGASQFDSGETEEGRAFLFLGNDGHGGLVRRLQQRTKNAAHPLAVVGALGHDGLFRLRCEFPGNSAGLAMLESTALEAWLEWEVKPLGIAFDGTDAGTGTPQALGTGGSTLTFDEFVSAPDAVLGRARLAPQAYHWRARVATNSPLFPNTAWFSVQGSSLTEAKLRRPWR